ncbi:hypothetical protein INR49_013791 [Caranx melampygus]|nr:hypothetical protein INR49_013791 [Caranx melampygus]
MSALLANSCLKSGHALTPGPRCTATTEPAVAMELGVAMKPLLQPDVNYFRALWWPPSSSLCPALNG